MFLDEGTFDLKVVTAPKLTCNCFTIFAVLTNSFYLLSKVFVYPAPQSRSQLHNNYTQFLIDSIAKLLDNVAMFTQEDLVRFERECQERGQLLLLVYDEYNAKIIGYKIYDTYPSAWFLSQVCK